MIIGISSGIIALCALIFAIWQGYETRKHNKLTYRPHLTTWQFYNSEKRLYSLTLKNNGLGPALIQSFIVKVDGKELSKENYKVVE